MAGFDLSTASVVTPLDLALQAEGVSGAKADLARSIYQQESSGGANTTTSNADAVGGMQVRPATFKQVADPGWNIKDPVQNARAGVRYLVAMLDHADGDPALAAAGYYGGPGAIDKARNGVAVSDPRNPGAPNTLQYGEQVAARMPAQPSFDLSTAKPAGGFDLSTAKPVTPDHAATAAQIDNDPISKGARNFNSGAGFLDNLNAGAGKAFSDLAQGVGQKIGLVSNADVAETRRLDAPLMKTGAAKIGNIGANLALVAPTTLLPGAATVPGAAVIGGIVGALQPSASTGEGFVNTALGAAGGAGGQAVANKAAGTVAFQEGQNALKAAQGAQKVGAAKAASDAGYVIPPEDLGGGLGTKILEGAGGKIKTAQVASQQNQTVTNKLAKQALGIPENEPLTQQALAAVRKAAGDAYDVVKGSGTITADQAYTDALDKIAQQATTAATAFPNAVKSDVPALVQALKEPSFSADGAVEMTKILRADADKAFASGDKGLGKATKDAADALESMMERHLQAQGMPDALKAFQEARKTIAKTYTVGKALNGSTGDVSAPALVSKYLDKGKPLDGELLQIAQASKAFPKATQALKEAPKTFSPLDMAYALKNLGTGNVKGIAADVATLGLRPAARSISLSGPMQRNMLTNAAQTPPANLMARLLANNELLLPAGITGGVTGANALTAALNR